jgi:hypothetical protein
VDPNAEFSYIEEYLSAVWDVHDIYNFTGYENQSLEIILTPPSAGDFDLYLYDSKTSKYIKSSENWGIGPETQEYIKYILPEDKEYYIRVAAKINNTKPPQNELNGGIYKLKFFSNVPPRWRESAKENYYCLEDSGPIYIEPELLWKELNKNDNIEYLLWNNSASDWELRDQDIRIRSTVFYDDCKVRLINNETPQYPDEAIKIIPSKNKFGITEIKLGARDKPKDAIGENNITLHIIPINDAPKINSTLTWEDQLGTAVLGNNEISIYEFNDARIKVDAYDVDGDNLEFSAKFQDNSTPFAKAFKIDSKSGIITFFADYKFIGSYTVNITAIDDGLSPSNLHTTKQVKFVITSFNLDRSPKTNLITPINGTTIKSPIPTLVWNATDVDTPLDEISYNVYLSNDLLKIISQSKDGLVATIKSQTQFTPINPLEDKITYYWTVIPNDGIFQGKCENSYRYFKVDTTVEAPRVELISPPNKVISNNTNIELKWDLQYDDKKSLYSDVYIGETLTNLNLTDTVTTTSYKPTNIMNTKTYYWQIIPKAGTGKGTIEGEKSPIWSFTIMKNYKPPIVDLISPRDRSILKSNNLSLSWSVDYQESENVNYKVFISTSTKFNIKPYEIVFINTYLKLNDLEENTYYWKVVPILNDVPGPASETRSFKISMQIVQPIVKPRFPVENATLNNTWVELKWSLDYSGPIAKVRYDLYLDSDTNNTIQMKLEKENYRQLFISYELQDHKTYYWRVIPTIEIDEGIIVGEFEKEVTRFRINTSYRPIPNPKFNISMTHTFLELSPGDSSNIKLGIANRGNVDLLINVSYSVEPINLLIISQNIKEITVPVNGGEFIEFNIVVPGQIDDEICVITLECKLVDFGLNKKEIITVEIAKNSEDDQLSFLNLGLNINIILASIAIIIIILIALYLIITNRRKKNQRIEETKDVSQAGSRVPIPNDTPYTKPSVGPLEYKQKQDSKTSKSPISKTSRSKTKSTSSHKVNKSKKAKKSKIEYPTSTSKIKSKFKSKSTSQSKPLESLSNDPEKTQETSQKTVQNYTSTERPEPKSNIIPELIINTQSENLLIEPPTKKPAIAMPVSMSSDKPHSANLQTKLARPAIPVNQVINDTLDNTDQSNSNITDLDKKNKL